MLVIYCCFSSVQTERKNHDFSSHVVVIRPNFYIINDAFSRFMAITIFCWRVQRRSMFHSISWKEIIIFPLLLIIEIVYYRFLDRNLYVVLVVILYTSFRSEFIRPGVGLPNSRMIFIFIWFFSNGFCFCSPTDKGGAVAVPAKSPLEGCWGQVLPIRPQQPVPCGIMG